MSHGHNESVVSITSSPSPGPPFMCVYYWTSCAAHYTESLTACMSYTSCFSFVYSMFTICVQQYRYRRSILDMKIAPPLLESCYLDWGKRHTKWYILVIYATVSYMHTAIWCWQQCLIENIKEYVFVKGSTRHSVNIKKLFGALRYTVNFMWKLRGVDEF